MRIFLSFLLVTLLFAISCTAPPAEEAVVDDTAQKEADIQAFKEIDAKWDKAVFAGDADAFMALVTDDYIRMEPDEPAMVGKEAFRESQQSFFDKYSLQDSDNVIEEIRLAGDWAYVRGSWSGTIIPKGGRDPISSSDKWIDIRERQSDGSWKISRTCGNSDAPLDLD